MIIQMMALLSRLEPNTNASSVSNTMVLREGNNWAHPLVPLSPLTPAPHKAASSASHNSTAIIKYAENNAIIELIVIIKMMKFNASENAVP